MALHAEDYIEQLWNFSTKTQGARCLGCHTSLITQLLGVMCRQVAVQWTTLQQAAGAVVQYGTTSGQYSSSANATFDTYTASQMCGGEAATTGYLFPGE